MFSDLFSFKGRNNRAKFWIIQLAIAAILFFAAMFDLTISDGEIGVIYIIAVLIILIPSLANQVKRWHDRNKSGWWIFIALIPIIGSIWALIETGFLRGTDGPNPYGPDPLKADKIIENQPNEFI